MPDDLEVTPKLTIPAAMLEWSFVRASGPGGQHVNKTSTAAELKVTLDNLATLIPADAIVRLSALASHLLSDDGTLRIVAEAGRSQSGNRRDASDRLATMIRQSLVRPKKRRPTRPSLGAKRRRLESKKQTGEKKAMRRKPDL